MTNLILLFCESGSGLIISAANRLIGEVVQSRRRPLLGPSPGWKRLLAHSHLRHCEIFANHRITFVSSLSLQAVLSTLSILSTGSHSTEDSWQSASRVSALMITKSFPITLSTFSCTSIANYVTTVLLQSYTMVTPTIFHEVSIVVGKKKVWILSCGGRLEIDIKYIQIRHLQHLQSVSLFRCLVTLRGHCKSIPISGMTTFMGISVNPPSLLRIWRWTQRLLENILLHKYKIHKYKDSYKSTKVCTSIKYSYEGN